MQFRSRSVLKNYVMFKCSEYVTIEYNMQFLAILFKMFSFLFQNLDVTCERSKVVFVNILKRLGTETFDTVFQNDKSKLKKIILYLVIELCEINKYSHTSKSMSNSSSKISLF